MLRRRFSGRPSPSAIGPAAGEPVGTGGSPEERGLSGPWWRQNLERSLPILLVGVVCLGIALWMYTSHSGPQGTRAPFWALLFAVGLVLALGGVALTLVEEPTDEQAPEAAPRTPPSEDPRYVRVDRYEWDRVRRQAAVNAPWDESLGGLHHLDAEGPIPSASERTTLAATGAIAGVDIPPESDLLVREISDLLVTPPDRSSAASDAEAEGSTGIPEPAWPEPRSRSEPEIEMVVAPPSPATVAEEPPEREVWVATRPEPPTTVPTGAPHRPRPPCVSCGGVVSSMDENCVVCDRPMCQACQDRAFNEGRPGLCPECDSIRRLGPLGPR